MRLSISFSIVVPLAGLILQAQANRHPCAGFPVVNSDLSACSTASAFCSSYLGSNTPTTKTVHRTKHVPHSTTFVVGTTTTTTTSTTGTTTFVDATSTITSGTVTTVTTDAPTCDSPSRKARREIEAGSNRSASCGINRGSRPSAIAGGCSCFLQQSTTVITTITARGSSTKTVTSARMTSTIVSSVEASTTTTPLTTVTTATSTSTICQPTGCAGESTDSFADASCPESQYQGCFCVGNVDGNTVCVATILCSDAITCGSDSDCPSDYWCTPGTNCGQVCSPYGSNCPNLTPGSFDFAARVRSPNSRLSNPFAPQ